MRLQCRCSLICVSFLCATITMPAFANFLTKVNDSSTLSPETKELMCLMFEALRECSAEKDELIGELKTEVASLQNRVERLESKLDEAGQYSRLDTITISPKKDVNGAFLPGTVPNFDQPKNTKNIVLQLFKDHLRLNLTDQDISISHRLQRPRSPTADHDRRNIIVRFCRKDLIGTIFRACKEMTPPFYINESLTPVRRTICYALRTLKKKHSNLKKVNTFKGVPRVFIAAPSGPPSASTRARASVTTDTTLKRIEISTILELENFVRVHLKTNLHDEGITIRNRM